MPPNDKIYGDQSPKNELPSKLSAYQIPGSTLSLLQDESGQIVRQELNTQAFNIKHTIAKLKKESNVQVTTSNTEVSILISLQNDLHITKNKVELSTIRQGQFNIILNPTDDLSSLIEKNKEYIFVSINFYKSELNNLSQFFEEIEHFLKNDIENQTVILNHLSNWTDRDILESVYRILHCNFETTPYQIYLELLIRILIMQLLQKTNKSPTSSEYSYQEVDGIYAAREMIRKNLRYHFIIRDIAQKVGINETKLKNGFKKLFGNGVYEFLQTERMEEARQLLIKPGKSVKEVASLTGYKSVNSFIKAFKKKYRYTPGEFRKQS